MRTLKVKTLGGAAIEDRSITDMAIENLGIYKEVGSRVTMGWNGAGPYGALDGKDFHFMDHLYTIQTGDKITYCAEPYGLEPEDIVELARLVEEGWDVSIGQLPLWYPGRTTQILIRRRGDSD